MFQRTSQMLMNTEGGSPGGGTIVPAPVPAAPQAAPQSPAPVTIDQIKSLIDASALESRNAIFADLRRTGALGKDRDGSGTSGAPVAPLAPTPSGAAAGAAIVPVGTMSMADVERLVEQREAVAFIAATNGLTPAQTSRLRKAIKADSPDDSSAYATSYLEEMGLLKSTQPVQPAAAAAPTTPVLMPPTGPLLPPISDKGAPATGNATDWEKAIADNPWDVSPAVRLQGEAVVGVIEFNRRVVQAARAKASGLRVAAK